MSQTDKPRLAPQRIAARIAQLVLDGYQSYSDEFRAVTRRARQHFADRDWAATQHDARIRLGLYGLHAERVIQEIRNAHPELRSFPGYAIRTEYGELLRQRPDAELAATFFNSVLRRIVGTVGVDPATEFVGAGLPSPNGKVVTCHTVSVGHSLRAALAGVLEAPGFGAPYARLEEDIELAARRLERDVPDVATASRIEMLPHVFYRNKGAYLVGRIVTDDSAVPLVLALVHPPEGITIDAVLSTADDVSVVFGFTRSYFHVEVDHPRETIDFLQTIMPTKRLDELYTALGYHKHGKTELYRALTQHLMLPYARFEPAPGDRGLVMIAFTLPSFNTVFKIIRDRFLPPKRLTRQEVLDKYRLVFVLDRAGRLADAQEFGGVELPRRCFAPEVLDELATEAADCVAIDQHRVVVRHLYTERRVTPLNIYFQTAAPEDARAAAVEYGAAIKDLAGANIFPGDMLSKNFGVTRHGRVLFYDYDELCLLTDCHFRRLPTPRNDEEVFATEPWYPVGERDVFPEEFGPFLIPPEPLREVFLEAHADLLTVDFWETMQRRVAAGELIDLFPYTAPKRLR